MSTTPATPATPAVEPPPKKQPGVDDNPDLVRAKVELELARVALEKQRLGLSEQSERTKLVKGMLPDFGTVAVEKDTTASSDKPSALAECQIQRAIYPLVDDIADTVMSAVNNLPSVESAGPAAPPWTFLVTSDTSYVQNAAALRDVLTRLEGLESAIDRRCGPETTDDVTTQLKDLQVDASQVYALMAMPAVLGGLNALPGALSLVTRLLSHQYVTSTYTSTSDGSVDLHAAGAILTRVKAEPRTTVLVGRLQPARDTTLEQRTLAFARALDGRLTDARSEARLAAARAAHVVERVSARRTQLSKRADDVLAAWKEKVGKSASSGGLAEDLALVDALQTAIASGAKDSAETKRLTQVLVAVEKRIDAVVKAVASGSGEMGAQELLDMLRALDLEDERLATVESHERRTKAAADDRVADLDAVHTAGMEFIESLASADATGERLMDKAVLGTVLDRPGTLVVYVHVRHAGTDGTDDHKLGADHRTTVYGASIEWALLTGTGRTLEAGVRTQFGYSKYEISDPENYDGDLIGYTGKPRVELARVTS